MSSVVAAIVGIPIMIGIGWLVWYVWNNNRLLDKKLANGDIELIVTTSFKVTDVFRATAGRRELKIALQPMAVDMSGYVRKVLPDGRIALVPISVNQEIKSVHSSMHTNQQPPSQ